MAKGETLSGVMKEFKGVVEKVRQWRRSWRNIHDIIKKGIGWLRRECVIRGRSFDDAFDGGWKEDFVIGEGVVVLSSLLVRSTKSCLGGIMVSLIFLEGLKEEA
ncbi:hypothetical protein Tco_0237315 [Tanacetum coccineum]